MVHTNVAWHKDGQIGGQKIVLQLILPEDV